MFARMRALHRFLPLRDALSGTPLLRIAHSPSFRKPYGNLGARAQKRGFACAVIFNNFPHKNRFELTKRFFVISGRQRCSLACARSASPSPFVLMHIKKSLYREDTRTGFTL